MGTGYFPGVKRLERGGDHPSLCSDKVKETVELYLYPLWDFVNFTFTFTLTLQPVRATSTDTARDKHAKEREVASI